MSKRIKLNNIREVKDFVEQTSKCDFDIDVLNNHYIVDGKSMTEILSMDLRKDLIVSYDGYSKDLEQTIKKYTVAS